MSRPVRRLRGSGTIGFRFGVILAVALFGFGILHRVLSELASRSLESGEFGSTFDAVARVVLSAAIAVGLAALLAYLISRRLNRRLVRLAEEASRPVPPGQLPGPFEVSGDDEIATIARTLNALRTRVAEQLKAFNLQDIRRREFIAQVSHDLRTPLTAQLACLDRADQVLDKPESPLRRAELRELLAVAKLDADRVHTLADDLLEIARLDAGDKLYFEPVPPGELVRQAVRRLEPLAAQRGIGIEVKITTRLPMLHADGRRLTRAIENLLRNAIQHGRSRVEVTAALAGETVRFEIRDNGRGLPKGRGFLDYLRRLSGDVRLTELARRRGRGDSAGLGLVVAQRVAEAHGGLVDAYNLSTGGAAFWLDIPVPPDGAMPSEESDPVEDARADG